MELIGQAQVLPPLDAIQYGYFSHVAAVESVFSGSPENESTAFFTFYNETITTRVTDNGPLRIVVREGTGTFYFNPSVGATFDNPDSFRAGTPVLTAELRHQVVLDTLVNTFIVQFDLTVESVETFTVEGKPHRLALPGQKLTWTLYGRGNTSETNPGQFVIAGVVTSHEPPQPGLSINRPAGSNSVQVEVENAPGARSRVEASTNLQDWAPIAAVDHKQAREVVIDGAIATQSTKFYRAITE